MRRGMCGGSSYLGLFALGVVTAVGVKGSGPGKQESGVRRVQEIEFQSCPITTDGKCESIYGKDLELHDAINIVYDCYLANTRGSAGSPASTAGSPTGGNQNCAAVIRAQVKYEGSELVGGIKPNGLDVDTHRLGGWWVEDAAVSNLGWDDCTDASLKDSDYSDYLVISNFVLDDPLKVPSSMLVRPNSFQKIQSIHGGNEPFHEPLSLHLGLLHMQSKASEEGVPASCAPEVQEDTTLTLDLSRTIPLKPKTDAPPPKTKTIPSKANNDRVEQSLQAPSEAPSQSPTEAPTEAPTEVTTEVTTEDLSEPPTEAPTHAPTEAPVEAPTQAFVNEPSDAFAEAPVEPPTESPVAPPTEPAVTEAPITEPAVTEPSATEGLETVNDTVKEAAQDAAQDAVKEAKGSFLVGAADTEADTETNTEMDGALDTKIIPTEEKVELMEAGLFGIGCNYASKSCQAFLLDGEGHEWDPEVMYQCLGEGSDQCGSHVCLKANHETEVETGDETKTSMIQLELAEYPSGFEVDWKLGGIRVVGNNPLKANCPHPENPSEASSGSGSGSGSGSVEVEFFVSDDDQGCVKPTAGVASEGVSGGVSGVFHPTGVFESTSQLKLTGTHLCITPKQSECSWETDKKDKQEKQEKVAVEVHVSRIFSKASIPDVNDTTSTA